MHARHKRRSTYAYVTNMWANNIMIINTATNTVVGAITQGLGDPTGIAFSPDGAYAYVTNQNPVNVTSNVVIINTATNTVIGTLTQNFPIDAVGIAFYPS